MIVSSVCLRFYRFLRAMIRVVAIVCVEFYAKHASISLASGCRRRGCDLPARVLWNRLEYKVTRYAKRDLDDGTSRERYSSITRVPINSRERPVIGELTLRRFDIGARNALAYGIRRSRRGLISVDEDLSRIYRGFIGKRGRYFRINPLVTTLSNQDAVVPAGLSYIRRLSASCWGSFVIQPRTHSRLIYIKVAIGYD